MLAIRGMQYQEGQAIAGEYDRAYQRIAYQRSIVQYGCQVYRTPVFYTA
jgi:hypothetical protein